MHHPVLLLFARGRRAVQLFAPVALFTAVLAVACTDRRPTALDITSRTDSLPDGRSPSFVVIPTEDAPETIAGSLGPGPNGEAAHPPSVIAQLPKGGFYVMYEATPSGALTGTWVGNGSPSGEIAPIGPNGILQGVNCVGVLQVNGSGFGGCGTAPVPKRYTLRDSVWLGRTQGPSASCNGSSATYSCIDYSGSHEVNLTRLSGAVELTASPSGAVRWGSNVYFTVTREPANLPMYVLGWKWLPDASSIPPKTSGCVGGTGTTCGAWMKESGTMEVTVFLNGKREVVTKHVEVVRRKLELEVSPGVRTVPGTQLTFTSTTDTAGGSRLSPTWAVSDSSAVAGSTCGAGAFTCKQTALKSFVMTHTARIDDSVQTVTREVSVVPCLTDDPVLDTDRVRDSLVALLNASGYPQLLPSDRVEQGAYILQNKATGAYEFRRSVVDPNATACGTEVVANYDTGTHILVATVHSHPYRLLEQHPPCGEDPSGLYSPLPSETDTRTLQALNKQLKEIDQPPIAGYFIDGNLVVKYDESGNQTNHQYVGGSCPWSQQP